MITAADRGNTATSAGKERLARDVTSVIAEEEEGDKRGDGRRSRQESEQACNCVLSERTRCPC